MKKRFERMKNLRKISKQYGEILSEQMIAKHKRNYTNQYKTSISSCASFRKKKGKKICS